MAKQNEHNHEHDDAHEEIDNMNIEKDFDRLTLEEVVYGNQHVLNMLLDILIEKGIVSEQEFKDKLEQMIAESPDAAGIKFETPEEDDEERL